MSEENINNLIDKYKAGKSTLKEEAFLFEHVNESHTEIQSIANFVKENKRNAPNHFNDKLWESFDKKQTQAKRIKLGFFSVAASIVLLVTLYINTKNENTLSISEKQALLNEAKNMFVANNQPKKQHQIIIENDLVVVYTKPE